jgi:hypothetical protein
MGVTTERTVAPDASIHPVTRSISRKTVMMAQHDMPYRIVKAKGSSTAAFVIIEDCEALDAVRARHGNRDLEVSVASHEAPDPSSRCVYALCFHITSSSLEQARRSALEAVYYVGEHFGIPQEFVNLTYAGGGVTEDDDRPRYDGRHDSRADVGTATPAQIVILVPPPGSTPWSQPGCPAPGDRDLGQ